MKIKKVVKMKKKLLPDLGLEVGDKVSWHGVIGKVTLIILSVDYPIVVDFGNQVSSTDKMPNGCFMKNGLYLDWHKTPSLKKIEKLKKVKKEKAKSSKERIKP